MDGQESVNQHTWVAKSDDRADGIDSAAWETKSKLGTRSRRAGVPSMLLKTVRRWMQDRRDHQRDEVDDSSPGSGGDAHRTNSLGDALVARPEQGGANTWRNLGP
jgi:hypothetical protein